MFMSEQKDNDINVILVGEEDLPKLGELVHAIEREESPNNHRVDQHAEEGFKQSIKSYNIAKSDTCWILLASVQGRPVGMAMLVRIPKLDHRIGFLCLDEIHVLKDYRRHGVGTALMEKAFELAEKLGLAGIRLLTRPANVTAQRFYERLDFEKHASILYERRIDPKSDFPLESYR
jgi:ribosomal protein S18 acetylase RimI-like enzyme